MGYSFVAGVGDPALVGGAPLELEWEEEGISAMVCRRSKQGQRVARRCTSSGGIVGIKSCIMRRQVGGVGTGTGATRVDMSLPEDGIGMLMLTVTMELAAQKDIVVAAPTQPTASAIRNTEETKVVREGEGG